MADAWRLRVGSAEDLDLVEPLWVAVHHRHVESMPALAPYVDDTDTWRARRKLYEDLLTLPDTLLLLAIVDERPVGYGLTHVMPVAGSWIEDTWKTGDRVGEIESLSVLPEYRGTGLGSQLLERLESHLRARSRRHDPRCAGGQHRRHPPLRAARLPAHLALSIQAGRTRSREPIAAVKQRGDNEIDEVCDVGAVPHHSDRPGEQRRVHERHRGGVCEHERHHGSDGVQAVGVFVGRIHRRPTAYAQRPIDDDHRDECRYPIAHQEQHVLETGGRFAGVQPQINPNAMTVTTTAEIGLRTRTPMVCNASDPL